MFILNYKIRHLYIKSLIIILNYPISVTVKVDVIVELLDKRTDNWFWQSNHSMSNGWNAKGIIPLNSKLVKENWIKEKVTIQSSKKNDDILLPRKKL